MLCSKSTTQLLTKEQQLVTIHYNGLVSFYNPINVESSCAIDVRNYPFDSQTCLLHFDSATYSTAQLLLESGDDTPIDSIKVYLTDRLFAYHPV